MGKTEKSVYWETRELVIIGTFAALIKISSFLVAITGGGMNPISMIAKNIVTTALLVILVMNVRKFGILTLYVLIPGLISLLTMGRGMMLLPGLLVAGVTCDLLIRFAGGYRRDLSVLLGIALFDILYRGVSLGIGFVMTRENPKLVMMAAVVVGIGYLGCIPGLFVGKAFAGELRHAGVIKE
jgi:energy-coupling factor transport system substrate-specific component